MADLDAVAPNYWRAQQRWPDALTLARCYEALNACYVGNAHGMVEHVKAFLESVCITIMGEFRAPMPSSAPSTTELLVAALSPLGMQNTRGASKLDKVLSGFNKLSDALSEMRNENGAIAHGKDGFLDALTVDHARAFLHAGDAILGVLLNALEGKQPDLTVTREPYENFPHLNDRIDRAVGVEARIDEHGDRPMVVFRVATGPGGESIELRIEPSRLLYGIDRAAYVEVLKTADLVAAATGEEEQRQTVAPKPAEISPVGVIPAEAPLVVTVPIYVGFLEPIRAGVEQFLIAEGVEPAKTVGDGIQLTNSLLATAEKNMSLDWKRRESLQARLRVACKRIVVLFGFDVKKAEEVAERLVTWLRTKAPDADEAH